MATAEVHIVAYDVEETRARGQAGAVGYTFTGMTSSMRTVLISHLEVILRKLKEHEERHPEEDDDDGWADEVWDRRGDPRERGRQEDGCEELHGGRQEGARGGEREGGSGLILPPGVKA